MEITLDIDAELLERMGDIADFQQISLNNAIVALIMQHVNGHNRLAEVYKQGLEDALLKPAGTAKNRKIISISR